LSPQKDNTLYEDATGQLSNGQGIYFFDGRTSSNLVRRALIAFDLSSIPTNATITGATLSMFLSQTQGGSQAVSLSTVSQDWGEGASNAGDPGGGGTQAVASDATWLHTFYNTNFWTIPGGDFSPAASATTTVSAVNTTYLWSGSGLVADVQTWVSNPASNFGWIIRGNEITAGRTQRFNSGENSSNPPQLTVTYQVTCVTPTPTETPTPTPTPTPNPTPTPTATPTLTPSPIAVSGAISYCSNPVAGPVADVMLHLTGDMTTSTLSDSSGNYQLSSLPSGGSYIVTPTKAALAQGSAGINTVDVVATQRHYLGLTLLTECRLTAADVNGDALVNTSDVVAIQRFILGQSTGISNTGKYQFSPASRSYSGIASDQTGQNYDTLVFGDVATGFVHRPEGGGEGTTAGEVSVPVTTLSLPNVAIDASTAHFITAVETSAIDERNKLVGFQGDFTFDERVVTFQSEPVQKAGITGGNWNVSGNVLPGTGPIRTLRISAFSNDFTPLSGSGTLFELKMTKVSQGAQSTQLLWATPPDFIFIDTDLNTHKPGYAASGSVILSGNR
jgi:hypothetical protein